MICITAKYENLTQLKEAVQLYPKYFHEIRLDLLKEKICFQDILELISNNPHIKFIFTLKSDLILAQKLLTLPNVYLDVDIKNIEAVNAKDRVIVSFHGSTDELQLVKNRLYFLRKDFYAVKIAINESSMLKLLQLYTDLKNIKNLIFIPMGKDSVYARLYFYHKTQNTYVTYKKGLETAFCQPVINDLQRYAKNTICWGILGGKQILNSLGLMVYNNLVFDKNLHFIYCPIVAQNINNADLSLLLENFHALSVTMPFKQRVGELVHGSPQIVNTVLKKNGEIKTYNTDILGLIFSLRRCFGKKGWEQKKVCIAGRGATAQSAKDALKRLGCNNIVPENYALLINATPVLLASINGVEIFDVNTGRNNTTGELMWIYQAYFQLRCIFGKSYNFKEIYNYVFNL